MKTKKWDIFEAIIVDELLKEILKRGYKVNRINGVGGMALKSPTSDPDIIKAFVQSEDDECLLLYTQEGAVTVQSGFIRLVYGQKDIISNYTQSVGIKDIVEKVRWHFSPDRK